MTEGNVSTNNIGLFFQDAWTVNNKLTINAGIRTEQEKVPTYATGDPTIPEFGIEWGFGEKLAPRVGFAYDLKGDGRWKAYGSWGIFYDIFKLRAAARLVGRRQVARVLLHARHLRLQHADGTVLGRPDADNPSLRRHAHPRTDRLPARQPRTGTSSLISSR